MNFKEIKELIQIMASEKTLDELEVERSGVRVRIKRSGASETAGSVPPSASSSSAAATRAPAPVAPEETPAEETGLVYVTSPIVGTFYRSSSPDADPFVGVGDVVEEGGVICIIEAMKLMNEIEVEASGEIVSVFVENGHPVEYGERLFAIRPR